MQTLQTSPDSLRPSTISVIRSSISQSGFRSLYTGLSASLLRQMSYSLVRLGAYEEIKIRLSRHEKPSTIKLLLAAGLAGGLGGVAGNPAGAFHIQSESLHQKQNTPSLSDIVLVRMTSDLVRPPDKRYNYSNAISGLISVVKTEGVTGLARGLGTNTVIDFHDILPFQC